VLLGRAASRSASAGAGAHPLDTVARVVGHLVLLQRERSVAGRVRALVGLDLAPAVWAALAAPEDAYVHVALDDEVPAAHVALLAEASRLLACIDAGYRRLQTFSGAESAGPAPFFVTGRRLDRVMALPPPSRRGRARKLEAAVNRDHPHLASLVRLESRSPALAAYCLAKALLLSEDRLLDQDEALMRAALAGR
jgi:hypothetical protein